MARPLLAFALSAVLAPAAVAQTWVELGPTTVTQGQTGTSPTTISGAVQSILADPSVNNRLFVGTVNGGVWRTTNGGSSWTPLTDNRGSMSIGSLRFDPTDAARNTLIAGFGRDRNSSFGDGGNRLGVTFSLDGGTSWTNRTINATVTPDVNGVIARDLGVGTGTIVASARVGAANAFNNFAQTGIWRSTNGGTSWTQVSGAGGSGLPNMSTYGVFENPSTSTQLFTVPYDVSGVAFGVYRSNDTGATWTRQDTGNTTLNNAMASAENVRISVSGTNAYLGLIASSGQLGSLWRSTDSGSTWTQFGGTLPVTNPGGQGSLHFNVQIDPTNSNRMYVTGDATQVTDFHGRVFRVDFANNTTTALFTNNTNAPHADGRSFAIRADGSLLQGSDGGIASMANPGTAGVGGNTWASLNSGLGTLEIHNAAFDPVSRTAFGGTQDNGTVRQTATGNTTWTMFTGGDGGQVAVAINPLNANQSIRYTSFQNFQGFTRSVFNNTGGLVSSGGRSLIVAGSGGQSLLTFESNNGPGIQFYTPIATNRADGNRLYVGTRRIYESTDQGSNATVLRDFGSGARVSAIKADGFSSSTARPEVLFVGVTNGQVWMRPDTGGALAQMTGYTGGAVTDLSIQPTDWTHLVVSSSTQVFRSVNASSAGSATFQNITGDLLTANPGVNRVFSVETLNISGLDVYLAGGRDGVYVTTSAALTTWTELGIGLPDALILDMDYEPITDTLLVAAFGRGVWTIPNFSANFVPIPEPGTLLLVAVGGLAVGRLVRRRRAG